MLVFRKIRSICAYCSHGQTSQCTWKPVRTENSHLLGTRIAQKAFWLKMIGKLRADTTSRLMEKDVCVMPADDRQALPPQIRAYQLCYRYQPDSSTISFLFSCSYCAECSVSDFGASTAHTLLPLLPERPVLTCTLTMRALKRFEVL